ncbi:MAG: hypothetical protein P8Z41_14545 [Anaerolineales bacterium]
MRRLSDVRACVDYSIQAKARSTLNTNSDRELDADQDGLPDGPFDVFPQGYPFLVEPDESGRRLIFLPQFSDEPFGYSLGISLIFEEARSQQKLQLAYYDEGGNLLGFVELLEGCAPTSTWLKMKERLLFEKRTSNKPSNNRNDWSACQTHCSIFPGLKPI